MAEASVAVDRSRAVCRRTGSAWLQIMTARAQDRSRDTPTAFFWGKEHCSG